MSKKLIPFNLPHMTGEELLNIRKSHSLQQLAGDGPFTDLCHEWLEQTTGCQKALLTHSCTAALEISAFLLDLREGDEVIMPSYTFTSTANAFALRGARLVFVDIRSDTKNLDESLIECAINSNTRAIVPVHYAGVACEMDAIQEIANHHGTMVVEDAAQCMMSKYRGRSLGTIGDFGCLSFHESKNIISGEGGALLINNANFIGRAEIVREKGTNRSQFFRGEVEKYTWQDLGSSYLPGELIAAFLWAQLEKAQEITTNRLTRWNYYHRLFESLEEQGKLRRPEIPRHCQHNGHIYYLILPSSKMRDLLIDKLLENNIAAVFHYVPLHSSPAGQKYGRSIGELPVTNHTASHLIRLPLWYGIPASVQDRISEIVCSVVG